MRTGLDTLLGAAYVRRFVEPKELEERKFAMLAAPGARWANTSTAEFESQSRCMYIQNFG
jgi:hypothetical protein